MENLDGLIKIVATVIGLVIYWSMSNKNKEKKKLSEGPTDISPPLPPRKRFAQEEQVEEYVDESPKYEPVTFEELLEQFGQSKKKETSSSRAERELNGGIDDEFIPATDTPEEAAAELNQFYKELHDENFKITEEDLKDHRDDDFKIEGSRQSRIAKLLQNPDSIRDAVILKEVFDRKYF